ncbi:hypothetical protein GQR58_012650 [Nymphon striatum]|nr:hypothetical protein GQR58_012650 [Nymphon striatum]
MLLTTNLFLLCFFFLINTPLLYFTYLDMSHFCFYRPKNGLPGKNSPGTHKKELKFPLAAKKILHTTHIQEIMAEKIKSFIINKTNPLISSTAIKLDKFEFIKEFVSFCTQFCNLSPFLCKIGKKWPMDDILLEIEENIHFPTNDKKYMKKETNRYVRQQRSRKVLDGKSKDHDIDGGMKFYTTNANTPSHLHNLNEQQELATDKRYFGDTKDQRFYALREIGK